MKTVGECAARELYISWETAVDRAFDRYQTVIDNYRAGKYPRRRKLTDKFLKRQGVLMEALSHIPTAEDLLDRYL